MEDHLSPPEDFEVKKESFFDVCVKIKLNYLVVRFAAFSKHPGKGSHKWNKACDKIFETSNHDSKST